MQRRTFGAVKSANKAKNTKGEKPNKASKEAIKYFFIITLHYRLNIFCS